MQEQQRDQSIIISFIAGRTREWRIYLQRLQEKRYTTNIYPTSQNSGKYSPKIYLTPKTNLHSRNSNVTIHIPDFTIFLKVHPQSATTKGNSFCFTKTVGDVRVAHLFVKIQINIPIILTYATENLQVQQYQIQNSSDNISRGHTNARATTTAPFGMRNAFGTSLAEEGH